MKVIASWGSGGAGKTTIALALAAALVQRKKDVLVIGTDTRAPMLPIYLPNNNKLDGRNSLGAVFEQEMGDGALKDKIIQHPQSDRLYFMGLTSGELSGISYRIPDRPNIQVFFQTLQHSPFAYCIVDCDSTPVLEPITLLALEIADVVLRVVTPDVKGLETIKAQLRWLNNSEDTFRTGRHIVMLNPIYPHTPLAEVNAMIGDAAYEMPWAPEVAEKQLAGRLLRGFDQADAVEFDRKIQRLADQIEVSSYGG